MSLAHFAETIFTSDGENARPAPEAVVTIYVAGTTTEAVLYSGITGSASLSNPVSADDDGNVSAYLLPGVYDIEITTAAGTASRSNVVVSGEQRTTEIAGTTHTLAKGDHGDILQFDSTSSCTIVLISGAPVGLQGYATNIGGGEVEFDAPTGVSILNDVTTAAAFSMVCWRVVDTNTYQLIGSVS